MAEDYKMKIKIEAEVDKNKTQKNAKEVGEDMGKEIGNGIKKEGTKGVSGFIKNVKDSLSSIGNLAFFQNLRNIGDLISNAFGKVKDFLSDMGNLSRSFEDAFTGVKKTVDGTTEQLDGLKNEFLDLSKEIPVTFEELSGIGEIGGQLGVPIENMKEFTKTVAELGVATTMTTEEAATSLAIISNITKEPLDNIEKLGSTVVALGNNFATNESKILSFSERIAGAGSLAGITTAEIMGISTAFSSVGIEAEAGGTAVTKVLNDINNSVSMGGKELKQYASVAGMSAEEFAKMRKEKPSQAFTKFVEGLGEAGDKANVILSEMGLNDSRLQLAFLNLANAGDLLSRSIDMSNEAFEENNALQKEADTRFATTTSQITLADNKWRAFGATIGDWWNHIWVPIYTKFTDTIFSIGTFLNNLSIYWNNLCNNIDVVFTGTVEGIKHGINQVILFFQGMINGVIGALNKVQELVSQIPFLGEEYYNDVKISDIELPTFTYDKTAIEKAKKAMSEGIKDAAETALNQKAKENTMKGILKDIEDENKVYNNFIKNLEQDNKKSGSGKSSKNSAIEQKKKELEELRDLKIQEIQESEDDELEKNKKLLEVYDWYKDEMLKIDGKTNDELLKSTEEYIKDYNKQRLKSYQDEQKEGEKHIKNIEKIGEEIEKIGTKWTEYKDKALKNLREVNQELSELDKDFIEDTSDRYNDLLDKKRELLSDNTSIQDYAKRYSKDTLQSMQESGTKELGDIDIKKILEYQDIMKEIEFIEEKFGDELKDKIVQTEQLTDTEKKYQEYLEKRNTLLEQSKIYEAYSSQNDLGEQALKMEDGVMKYYDAEKEAFVEIQDFKNQEIARELLTQQEKLQQEYDMKVAEQQQEYELMKEHSLEMMKIYQTDTVNFQKELDKKKISVEKYVADVKRALASIPSSYRAYGGTLNSGVTLVGENGPEAIVARTSSYVQPRNAVATNSTVYNNQSSLSINGMQFGNFNNIDDMLAELKTRLTYRS